MYNATHTFTCISSDRDVLQTAGNHRTISLWTFCPDVEQAEQNPVQVFAMDECSLSQSVANAVHCYNGPLKYLYRVCVGPRRTRNDLMLIHSIFSGRLNLPFLLPSFR